MKKQRVRTKQDNKIDTLVIEGWLDGRNTYLWFGNPNYIGCLSDRKLYRLAKAIVKRFEEDK